MKFFYITFTKLFFVLFICLQVNAQNAPSLPYSQFGFGTLNQEGTFINRSFSKGGIGYASSINPNLNNPATLSFLDKTSAELSLENGANFYRQTGSRSSFQNNVSFYNLALAFPASKRNAWTFGYLPYATKGYKTSYYEVIPNVGLAHITYSGEGNLSRAYIGTAYKIISKHSDSLAVSVGTNANAVFGSNYQMGAVEFNADYKLMSVSYNSQNYYKGFYLDPSIYFQTKTKKGLFSAGFVYQVANPATVTSSYFSQSYYLTPSQTVSSKDVFLEKQDTIKINLPQTIKCGIYFENVNGHGFALDVQQTNFKSTLYSKPLNTVSATWQYDARKSNQTGFFNNTIYRLGFYFSKTNWVIKNQQINSMGINSSFSFPTPGKFAYNRLQIGFTAGVIGTTQNNLLAQRFITVNAGVLFGDVWFKRPKID
ncbi:MAG: hypothetical protein IT239_03135 [Bacteroidia bacterium]|nr:hypothetical protein [Bacteroidia bacterium]